LACRFGWPEKVALTAFQNALSFCAITATNNGIQECSLLLNVGQIIFTADVVAPMRTAGR
jgi:hypothetical protein